MLILRLKDLCDRQNRAFCLSFNAMRIVIVMLMYDIILPVLSVLQGIIDLIEKLCDLCAQRFQVCTMFLGRNKRKCVAAFLNESHCWRCVVNHFTHRRVEHLLSRRLIRCVRFSQKHGGAQKERWRIFYRRRHRIRAVTNVLVLGSADDLICWREIDICRVWRLDAGVTGRTILRRCS